MRVTGIGSLVTKCADATCKASLVKEIGIQGRICDRNIEEVN